MQLEKVLAVGAICNAETQEKAGQKKYLFAYHLCNGNHCQTSIEKCPLLRF